ncbi:MAG TPA: glutaredoxin domain-containing protein [Anaerolineae bacterium]|jgi:glutaredoxin-like YruB-family protein|nr:glutaredoxin domain-containing protein [Anaerolineae bacterium]
MATSIKIYTTPTCAYCSLLKKFLLEKAVEYEEIDLAADPGKVNELVEVSGQLGVPVTVIDGREVIIGYDRARLQAALAR